MHGEPTTAPRRRALLIESPVQDLQGTEHDVATMRQELEAWGFACVHELVGPAATRDAILDALRMLVEEARADDVLVIYYCGHGGWCELLEPGDEASELPTAFLVPMDIEANGSFRPVLELELGVLVDQLARRTKNVTVILDCCHSAAFRDDGDVPRALKKREIEPGPLQDELRAKRDQAKALHSEGHPDVVWLAATASGSPAYERMQPDGHVGGYFTYELCAALAEARAAPQPWATIVGQVRERIAARRKSMTQRPQVTGPERRHPFSLVEPPYEGEQSTLAHGNDGAMWIRAGRLHGLSVGDVVELHELEPSTTSEADAKAVQTATIAAVSDDSARLALEPVEGTPPPEPGQPVVVRKPTLRKTVRVDPSALEVEGLVAELGTSPRLELLGDAEPGREEHCDFVVALEDDQLQISGSPSLSRLRRPKTPEGIVAVVDDLDHLARSALLLEALESPPGEPLPCSRYAIEVFVTPPGHERPRVLVPNETLEEGTRIYVEARHQKRGTPTLYVNVLDRGISERLQLVNRSEPAGVQLLATQTRWVGRRSQGGPPGLKLCWPKDVPKNGVGREELVIVVSQRPLDLRALLEGRRTRRDPTRSTRSEGVAGELGAPLSWAVIRMSFGVTAASSPPASG